MDELFRTVHRASERLDHLNVFNYVGVKLDTDKQKRGKAAMMGSDKDEELEVTFFVEESGWIKSKIGAEAGTQSGGAVSHC